MNHGIKVWREDGGLLISSEKGGFLLVDTIDLPAGTPSGERTYPDLIGYKLYTQQVFTNSVGGMNHHIHAVVESYDGGIPKVAWSLVATSISTTLYVFAN